MLLLLWLAGLSAAGGVASSCVGNASYHCLSHKLSKAVFRINNIPEIPVTDWLSLVRENRSYDSGRTSQPDGLLEVMGEGIDTFLETRSLRLALPNWARTAVGNRIDIDIAGATQVEEGRRKGGGGGGKKGHGMGMMMMAMMGKMAMMSMGIIKMKAMKALIIGGESHVIVIGGHGGGHGGGGGGGGHGGGGHGGGGGGGGHGGYGGGSGSTGAVHIVQESYGPPSSGGGWSGGAGGGGGGDSWSGGGGGGGGWTSGGGGGGGHGGGGGAGGGGGWSSGGGGGGGWSSGGGSGGWGKRAYAVDNTYTISPIPSKSTD